ncbi:hypothetical protein BMI91_09110 [Thioclava sediminum]|uniref:Uncharacterized protein n=1 Tax=Thioclava sediminum TaxID=1915319 RepID=A0ABX3MX02_9RHOB|nr:hypothetical protein [Thioclava sediminum]OOY24210.1 hypothetical protein BMI91_09110 [Thioclava sediminum]
MIRISKLTALALCGLVSSGPVAAQNFTTAAEVRPILGMTRDSWVAIREYGGKDLVYFTHLLAWRCGLSEIRYGFNGAPPTKSFKMEKCHEGTAQPNAISGDNVYVSQPQGSVSEVRVKLIYDDGSTEEARFNRKAVLQ